MKTSLTTAAIPAQPTAHIAVNKSRLKAYNNNSTYYLKNGTEFQIELFNPTTGNILAKIEINGAEISQGGLVLRPGERTFLKRFLDEDKAFLFETYEVSANNQEVKAAIVNNGDFKVTFHKERPIPRYIQPVTMPAPWTINPWPYGQTNIYYGNTMDTNSVGDTYLSNDVTFTTNGLDGTVTCSDNGFFNQSSLNTLGGSINISNSSNDIRLTTPIKKSVRDRDRRLALESKTMETGRVEKGNASNQEITTVDMDFEYYSFHTVTYKLLPESQKINTTADLQVKSYCTNCGAKLKKEYKFCPACGTKN